MDTLLSKQAAKQTNVFLWVSVIQTTMMVAMMLFLMMTLKTTPDDIANQLTKTDLLIVNQANEIIADIRRLREDYVSNDEWIKSAAITLISVEAGVNSNAEQISKLQHTGEPQQPENK